VLGVVRGTLLGPEGAVAALVIVSLSAPVGLGGSGHGTDQSFPELSWLWSGWAGVWWLGSSVP
jgi:hypothetical protein